MHATHHPWDMPTYVTMVIAGQIGLPWPIIAGFMADGLNWVWSGQVKLSMDPDNHHISEAIMPLCEKENTCNAVLFSKSLTTKSHVSPRERHGVFCEFKVWSANLSRLPCLFPRAPLEFNVQWGYRKYPGLYWQVWYVPPLSLWYCIQ